MKASELVESLNEIIKKHGDLKVVYSIDEEGNSFHEVGFPPLAGNFEDREFIDEQSIIDEDKAGDLHKDDFPINSICIN